MATEQTWAGREQCHESLNLLLAPDFRAWRGAKRCFAAALLLIVAAAAACDHREPTESSTLRQPFPLETRAGWFHGSCLGIAEVKLARGTAVDLVVLGQPQTVLEGQVGEPMSSESSCPPLLESRRSENAKPGTSFYSIEGTKLTATDMGIAIVDPPQRPAVVDGIAQVDLNSDGRKEFFSSCATTEGIRFAISTDKSNRGTPLWAGYYYLGYDMQPTCP